MELIALVFLVLVFCTVMQPTRFFASALSAAGSFTAMSWSSVAITLAADAAITAAVSYGVSQAVAAIEGPPPDIEGPRLTDIPVQTSTENAFIPRVYGERARLAGNLIWTSYLKESKHVEVFEAGKDEQKVISFKYSVDLALALCEGPMEGLREIYANGTKIYDDLFDGSLSIGPSNQISIVDSNVWWLKRIKSSTSGPDLSGLNKQLSTVTLTGCSNSANNIINRWIIAAGVLPSGETYADVWKYPLLISIGNGMVTEAAGNNITVSGIQLGYAENVTSGIDFYDGSSTQAVNARIDLTAAATAPAFRGTCYVVINDLKLEDFGNRIPQFQFIVTEHTGRTVAELIEMLLAKHGLDSSEYDTSNLSTQTVKGFILDQNKTTLDALNAIMRAYNLTMTQSDGVLRFYDRDALTEVTVSGTELAAHTTDSDPPRTLAVSDVGKYALPYEMNLQYFDTSNGYFAASTREKRFTDVDVPNKTTFALPVVLGPEDARRIVRRELWKSWVNKQTIQFSLPPKYLRLQESDRVVVPTESGLSFTVLLVSITRGNNFILECTGIVEETETIDIPNNADSEDGTPFSQDRYIPSGIYTLFIDLPALAVNDKNKPGFYVACAAYDPNAEFTGARLAYLNRAEDTTTLLGAPIIQEALIGWTENELYRPFPNGMGPGSGVGGDIKIGGVWDRTNTVDVAIVEGVLSSATEQDVLEGRNIAYIQDTTALGALPEVFGFVNATYLGDTDEGFKRYRLSTLLRGLLGTEMRMATVSHTTNADFAVLRRDTITFQGINKGLIGTEQGFRIIPQGGDISDAPIFAFTPRGGTTMGLTPFSVDCWIDPADNDTVRISWEKRAGQSYGNVLRMSSDVADGQEFWISFTGEIDGVSQEVFLPVGNTNETSFLLSNYGYTAPVDIDIKLYQVNMLSGKTQAFVLVSTAGAPG